MGVTIKEGNYNKFGVCEEKGGYIFTFTGEKEQECYIRIYNKTNELVERILVPKSYCMGAVRSVFISGLKEKELRYNYEIDGEIITDIYADKIMGREIWNDAKRQECNYAVYCGKEKQGFDWEGDDFPEIPRNQMVMYKLHTRGFSMDGGAKGKKRGTFAAIAEKLEYLKGLGVTTIELMPVYEFEEILLEEKPGIPDYIRCQASEKDVVIPEDGGIKAVGLNYWGYGQGNYYAVKSSYASTNNASKELKELIKLMHKNGMECVLEMFFPSGMNQNVILSILRFWVREYHVDGFHLLGESVPVKAVSQDMFLSRTKLFYHVFPGELYDVEKAYPNLYVYNDDYLYEARKLLNHNGGSLAEFANQQKKQHEQVGFVNYVACNNGFTLMDTFSYQTKHNEENGENNVDGNNWNFSNNYGVEGRCNKRHVVELRKKQVMNALTMQFMAQGVPLIWAGDEMCNSQNGNNNAYCQDNKISWLNWKKDGKNTWLTEFVSKLATFRRAHPILTLDAPMHLNDYKRKGCPDLSYHADSAWLSGFYQENIALGVMYCGDYVQIEEKSDDYIYVGYNFRACMNRLALPKLPNKKKWYLVMNTADINAPFAEKEVCLEEQRFFSIAAQSCVILIGK
ncbi:MAG: glycogen operon protein GlgX [Roseburia sp.]|nr:glycogen operon protein GlgX [Roseburia sp.]